MSAVVSGAPPSIRRDGARLGLQVEDGAMSHFRNAFQGNLEVSMAGTESGPKDVSRDALAVDTHQGGRIRRERTDHEEHMLTAVNAAFIGNCSEESVWGRQHRFFDTPDMTLVA